jgi:hypothetical protein
MDCFAPFAMAEEYVIANDQRERDNPQEDSRLHGNDINNRDSRIPRNELSAKDYCSCGNDATGLSLK